MDWSILHQQIFENKHMAPGVRSCLFLGSCLHKTCGVTGHNFQDVFLFELFETSHLDEEHAGPVLSPVMIPDRFEPPMRRTKIEERCWIVDGDLCTQQAISFWIVML